MIQNIRNHLTEQTVVLILSPFPKAEGIHAALDDNRYKCLTDDGIFLFQRILPHAGHCVADVRMQVPGPDHRADGLISLYHRQKPLQRGGRCPYKNPGTVLQFKVLERMDLARKQDCEISCFHMINLPADRQFKRAAFHQKALQGVVQMRRRLMRMPGHNLNSPSFFSEKWNHIFFISRNFCLLVPAFWHEL